MDGSTQADACIAKQLKEQDINGFNVNHNEKNLKKSNRGVMLSPFRSQITAAKRI